MNGMMREIVNELDLSGFAYGEFIRSNIVNLGFDVLCVLCILCDATHHIDKFKEEINWMNEIFYNTNQKVIDFLERLLDENPELPVDWDYLSMNLLSITTKAHHPSTTTMHILKKHPDKVSWFHLCCNRETEAVEMILNNIDKIEWDAFSTNSNPKALEFLEQNHNKIVWQIFCQYNNSDEAFNLMLKYPNNIRWDCINDNTNSAAVNLLYANKDRNIYNNIEWKALSKNPAAINLLIKHYEIIDWVQFSKNENPYLEFIIKEYCIFNPEYLKKGLCKNSEAVNYLTQHPNVIDWTLLMQNNGLFKQQKDIKNQYELYNDYLNLKRPPLKRA